MFVKEEAKIYFKLKKSLQWEVVASVIKPYFFSLSEGISNGFYLIDFLRDHETHKKEWCNLHKPIEDGTGFYEYVHD